jgi:ribonuclease H-related protein
MSRKYYAVRVGVVPGIYTNWRECKKQVARYKGAVYKSFTTLEAAQEFLTPQEKKIEEADVKTIIHCDGGHNKMTGEVAYACVVDGRGKDLLKKYDYLFSHLKMKEAELPVGNRNVLIADFSDVSQQQNNDAIFSLDSKSRLSDPKVAELLAMYAALLIALHTKTVTVICSDSQLIVEFWSKKLSPKKAATMDPNKVQIIHDVIKLRKEFESEGGIVKKISGDDNLADLGFHVKVRKCPPTGF